MTGYGRGGAQQYKQQAIMTASKGQILIMLYEAAIQNVRKASDCIEKKDTAGKAKAILKTHDIINELLNSLDYDAGGQIARDLERLYNFMTEQLLKANIEGSQEALAAVRKNLETLLSAWRGAVEQVQKGQGG
jgi:flagellar secretion chaperone FliS